MENKMEAIGIIMQHAASKTEALDALATTVPKSPALRSTTWQRAVGMKVNLHLVMGLGFRV